MIFNSAGHNTKGPRIDPGAVANGKREADLTIIQRDLINKELKTLQAPFFKDLDSETLGEYVKRIHTGTGSVICESHFNAGPPSATGIEVLVPYRYTSLEFEMAREIALAGALIFQIPLRGNKGVKTEADTRHSRLAIMRPEGINCLIETCFISNPYDLERWEAGKEEFARRVALILKTYDEKVS